MTEAEREAVVTVRMSADERSMVQQLADADGVSVSDAVRMSVRRAHADRFAPTAEQVAAQAAAARKRAGYPTTKKRK